jgi:hypothetical protein
MGMAIPFNSELLASITDMPLHELYMVERDVHELIEKKEKLQQAVEEYWQELWD